MSVCEELGEQGSQLAPFTSLQQYRQFYTSLAASPAFQEYCQHGGRRIVWLPYQGWDDITGTVNVTHWATGQPLTMHSAWRRNNPKSSERPYCVVARLGESSQFHSLQPSLYCRLLGGGELGGQQVRPVGFALRLGPGPLQRLHPPQHSQQKYSVRAAGPVRPHRLRHGLHGDQRGDHRPHHIHR